MRFQEKGKRDALLEKSGRKRIYTSDPGMNRETRIYVNEHLCKALKRQLRKAVPRKYEETWTFVWIPGGKIFTREKERTRILQIYDDDDC